MQNNSIKSNILRNMSLILLLSYLSNQKCVYYQPSDTSRPLKSVTDEQLEPETYVDPGIDLLRVCPDYIGKKVCCKEAGRNVMAKNFMKLLFIADCQNCRNNIYRMM